MDKKKINITTVIRVAILMTLAMNLACTYIFAKSVQEKFKDKQKLVYKVYANGIPSGHIEWEYLGQKVINGKVAEVLSVNSNTSILKFLNLTSKEKVFLDRNTYLPLKVERDIVFFGKKELIQEIYNQDQGYVKITKSNDRDKESIFYCDKPIHNILALLYFFPEDIDLEKGEWITFNLPTQKVKIKFIRERILVKDGKRLDCYFLIGQGAKRFNLWLDKESRLPLRIDFIFPLGKIVIESKN